MIELPVYNRQGKQVETISIDEADLGGEILAPLLKQAYVMFHANRRQGSARTRNRARTAGSTRKLFRQKGTGNARVGPRRTPTRKGGGVAFAKTRTGDEFRQRMPKKMRRLANRNALLAKLVGFIRDLNRDRGYTFCIIEHDMGLIAELCDPVIVMAQGKVLTSGRMEDVRRDPRVLEAYLGSAA